LNLQYKYNNAGKKITTGCYFAAGKLDDIKGLLDQLNLNGLSVCQVMGFGRQKGWKEFMRGTEVDYNFLPKIKLEIVVADDEVENICFNRQQLQCASYLI